MFEYFPENYVWNLSVTLASSMRGRECDQHGVPVAPSTWGRLRVAAAELGVPTPSSENALSNGQAV